MEKGLISVIVPVWNVAQRLPRCLDSILAQTYKNLEIICIDDASPDMSPYILREYGAKDSRIKIITHKKNQGVSAARNDGMAAARGEYIGFVDSDDYIARDFYEKLYKKAIQTDADVVKGKVAYYENGKKMPIYNFWELSKTNKYYFCGDWIWVGLYRVDLLRNNNIVFPTDVCHSEDVMFNLQLIYFTNRPFELCKNAKYYYIRTLRGSGNSVILSQNSFMSMCKCLCLIMDFINTHDMPREDYLVVLGIVMHFRVFFSRDVQGTAEVVEKCRRNLVHTLFQLYSSSLYKQEFFERAGGGRRVAGNVGGRL